MSYVLCSAHISKNYLKWMPECDAKARMVLYAKENTTKKGTPKNDLSQVGKKRVRDATC